MLTFCGIAVSSPFERATMPPVSDALQAIFPDITSPVASVVDEPAVAAGGTEQGNLQSVEDGSKSYSSRMSAINSKYSAAVDNFSHQQQYLLSQQEQAKKADEDALIQADSEYTPGWRKAGLPTKGSHLVLDSLQVQQAGLENPQLVLQQYGAFNSKEVLSPLRVTEQNQAGADPHYCSLTSNLQVRSKLVPAKRRAEAGQGTTWRALAQDDLKARLAASSVRRKAMSHTMPKDQWDLEKKIINSMHHKLTFLRNPRFPSPEKHIRGALPDHPPAASAKSLGSSRSGSPSKGTRAGLPQVAFRAEPGQVLFRDCEVGQTYQQLVKLRNCTSIGQRLRLIPSSTPFLSFSSLVYTSEAPEPGLIAPGMHVGVTVTFTPNSLHDVDDVMVVETGQGSLQVPLLVRRDPPTLTLPHQILIGPTLVSNQQVMSVTCTNNGGPGQFSIIGQGQDPGCPDQDKGIRLGPFEVSPADFALDRGEAVQLSIAFSPAVAGDHSESFVVLCDNGVSTAHQLSGQGSEVCVQLHSLEGRLLSEAERRQPIWFGDVVVGARQQRVVRLHNSTPLPLPFCWQQTDEPVAEGSQHAQHEMTDGRFGAMQFHAEPAVGILEAGAAADIALLFCPDSQHRFLSWAQLLVDTSVPGSSIVPKYSKRVLEIALEGIGAACSVSVWPPIIRCPAILELGQVVKQELTVSNPGQAAAHVTWSCAHPAVALLPSHATVAAGSKQLFQVVITGREIGRIQAELVCSVEHGAAQAIEVTAAVAGPRVEFEDPGLIFGLVQLGTQVSQQITIRNPSRYSPASWTLRELPQHSSSTSSTELAAAEQPSSSSSTVDEAHLNGGAQRAQQGGEAKPLGVPALLQEKGQQLLEQLRGQQSILSEATPEAAAEASHQTQSADLGQLTAPVQTSEAAQQSAHPDAASGAVTDASGNCQLSVVGPMAGDEVEANQGGLSNPFEVAAATGEEEGVGVRVRVQLQPEWGLLAPGASTTIQVLMNATAEGVFNTTLELFTKGGATAYLSGTAAIIAPSLAMTPTHLDLGVTHLGVPRVCSLTLSNLTMLPTSFAWEAYGSGGVGVKGGEMSVVVDPVQGLLEPGGQLLIQATFTPTAIGPAEALVACCTAGPKPPAGFSTVSHVRGLSVTYNIQTAPLQPLSPHVSPGRPIDRIGTISDSRQQADASASAVLSDTQTDPAAEKPTFGGKQGLKHRQAVTADFGECSIGETKSLLLTLTNGTPIEASVSLWLNTFQAADLSVTADAAVASSSDSFLPGKLAGGRSHAVLPSLTPGKAGCRSQSSIPSLTLSSPIRGMVSKGSHASPRGHKGTAGRTASPAGFSYKSQHAMAALTLSEEAERSRPFASALGQLMMTQRATEAAAKQVVGGKGIAMGLTPSHGLLPPGGSFTCTISCTTDMCGDYADILHVQIGDLPVKKIPVHVSVTGTPLIMQLGRVLLPGFPRNPTAAQHPAQPLARLASRKSGALGRGRAAGLLQAATEEVPAGLVLDFGQLVADSPAEHAFHVFNTSALPVKLSWTFYRYGLPGPIESRQASHPSASIGHPPRPPAQPVRVVAVHWAVDNAAELVRLSTTILANPAEQPFRIEPSTAVIAGNGSAKFAVSLSTPDAMLHAGYLLGTQQIVAPESRVALHCSVTEGDDPDRPDEAEEETEEASRVGSEEGASQGANSLPGGASSGPEEVVPPHGSTQTVEEVTRPVAEAEQPLVVCQISGGFHPYAGRPAVPLQPLRVNLNANVIQPHLEVECVDGKDCLAFVCHANNDPATHPSYRQTVLLTNMHSCPLHFTVSMAAAAAASGAGRFEILRAACSSVSRLEGLQPRPLLPSLGSGRGTRQHLAAGVGSQDDSLVLRPHDHISVCIQYIPQQQHCRDQTAVSSGISTAEMANLGGQTANMQSTTGYRMIQDESVADHLLIMYSNGHQQALPVTAQCLQPVLQASKVSLDFGAVHVHSPKTLEVELANTSLADATWSAQIVPAPSEAGAAASVSFAQAGQLAAGPSQAALLSGTGMSSKKASAERQSDASVPFAVAPSSGVLIGRGLTLPKKQMLLVTFAPKQVGLCTAELSVLVAHGQTVKLGLSGQGTHVEADETAARL